MLNSHGIKGSPIQNLKWCASFRWSFGPIPAWSGIETTTILKTQPTLEYFKSEPKSGSENHKLTFDNLKNNEFVSNDFTGF